MIKTQNLSKKFGRFTAVNDLSFEVGEGEVLGFLGPNGAGKSTTMKMLTGFLTPSAGSASVCGFDVVRDSLKAKTCIGYLPEGAPHYGEMTPADFLNFISSVRGLSGQVAQSRMQEVIERLGLKDVMHQPIDTLSKGFKRRVGLAQAIIHDPKVLILDEPTDGLDPNQKHEVRALINSISKNKIIIISTHILEEVHAVCSRAVIIAHGKRLADDTPEALQAQSKYHGAVRLKFAGEQNLEQLRHTFKNVAGVKEVELDDKQGITLLPASKQDIWQDVERLVKQHDWKLDRMEKLTGQLDDVFRTITREVSHAQH